ncbi:helix-turn-helix transcriptional regulator [Sphingobium sp. MI1205]|uniref:helix-turn-helix transcriptional regulator n=1 Tax=Sphingobium sp. MI1205 TaxID=407020 RepID=UPI001314F34E|nr:AraC family transcriptional regulator [Sphingobium sp. MI1205]
MPSGFAEHIPAALPSTSPPVPGPADGSFSELIMQDLRAENGYGRIVQFTPDDVISISASAKPVIYAVLEGEVVIQSGRRLARLEAGDVGLIFYGDEHRLGNGKASARLATPPIPLRPPESLETVRFGEGPAQAVVMQCFLELSYVGRTAYSNRAMPKLVALRSGTSKIGDDGDIELRAFPFDPELLHAELRGIGGYALAYSFANMELCQALRCYTTKIWGGREYRDVRSPNRRRMTAIMREVCARPEHDWSVERMARYVGLSRSAFAAAFQELVGEAPIGFLTRERMKRAAKLLLDQSLSMQEVGKRVGYEIESSFARAFKRHWGVSPRAFIQRRNHDEQSLN